MSDPLIILLGMPRSGTTWLGKLFDSHPETLYFHEPDSSRPFAKIPLLTDSAQQKDYREELLSFVHALPSIRTTKVCGSLPVFSKRYLSAPRFLWRRCAVLGAKAGARLFGEFPVLDVMRPAGANPIHLVWKSIESVGRAGLIAETLPHARLIFEVRHPCGYIASVLRGEKQGKFSADGPISSDYGLMRLLLATEEACKRRLTMDYLESSEPVVRLAWQWLLFNEKALNELEGRSNVRVVRYEDLCARPMECTRELFEFASLSWNRQTELFVEKSTCGRGGDFYGVYKDPSYAANRWKEELGEREIDLIRNVTANSRAGSLYFTDSLS